MFGMFTPHLNMVGMHIFAHACVFGACTYINNFTEVLQEITAQGKGDSRKRSRD